MAKGCNLEVGDSFEIQNENGKHLHFIIAEESHEAHSQIILVYVSSSNTIYKDNTTIIKLGEHPYIINSESESWVRYQNTILCSREEIAPLITIYYGKISESLLGRIQDGLERSTRVKKEIKQLYHEWKMNKLFDSLK